MKSTSKKRTPNIVNLTVKRRYLTEREVERLMDCARKYGRYGHRDATMILVAYRHGLRASEVCDLQWQQIELSEGRLHVHRVKNGIPSVHPIRGDEMRALRKLRRDYPTDAHVFVSERGGPISPIGFHRLVQRLGEAAKMPFQSTRTCFAMPVGSSSPTMATTRGLCSTISGTRTFSTPSGTPTWHPTGSRTFGGMNVVDAPSKQTRSATRRCRRTN
jgi:type 1 fimbriae regulatory protein FimB/type 1 fimbriae regulatory protein FimE